jgi:hypothetical protein
VVIDGMTLPDASAMNMSLYDLELLEFVRTSGTLYGKNQLENFSYHNEEPTNKNRNKITISKKRFGLFGARLSSGPMRKNKQCFFWIQIVRVNKQYFLDQKVDFSRI